MSGLSTEDIIKRFRKDFATMSAASMMSKNFADFEKVCEMNQSDPVSMLVYMIDRVVKAHAGGFFTSVLEFVEKHPLCGARDLATFLNKSESYTRKEIIESLVDAAMIERVRVPSRTKPQSGYRLTRLGFSALHKDDGAELPDYLNEDKKEALQSLARAAAKVAGFQNPDALYLQLMQGNTEELDSVIAKLKLAALSEMDSYAKAGTKK